jgi:hypothetical protein
MIIVAHKRDEKISRSFHGTTTHLAYLAWFRNVPAGLSSADCQSYQSELVGGSHGSLSEAASLFLAQLHIARAIGVLLTAMRARTLPALAPGEGLVVNLDCVTNRKLSTAARAIHQPQFFSLWHLWPARWDGPPNDSSKGGNWSRPRWSVCHSPNWSSLRFLGIGAILH